MGWLGLVVACRSDLTFKHNKDVITGNVGPDVLPVAHPNRRQPFLFSHRDPNRLPMCLDQ